MITPGTPIVTVKIDNPQAFSRPWAVTIRAIEYFIGSYARELVRQTRRLVPEGVQHIHPKSTRKPRRMKLRSSIRVLKFTKAGPYTSAVVGTTLEYAKHLVDGTVPHVIAFRRAKVLTIWAPGANGADSYGYIFRRSVVHPGSKPRDYRPAAAAAMRGAITSELFSAAYRKLDSEVA